MADTKIDLNSMSEDDIAALATRCLEALSLADRVKATLAAFHTSQDREELEAWLQEEADAEESEGQEEE